MLAAIAPAIASGHAGLIDAEPTPGATLGAAPSQVQLTLSEEPEPSLSEIAVLGPGGTAVQRGDPRPVDGDPLTLAVPVRPLSRGVYTVNWKVVSAVDGHATEGTHVFGVKVSPSDAAVATTSTTPASSPLELIARWLLLTGMVTLLGASVAGATRPGRPWRGDLMLAVVGWGLAAVGLTILTEAQRRTADSSLAELLGTPIGDSLLWRAAALAATAVALIVAWRAPRLRRGALAVGAATVLAAIVAGASGGHAAAGTWPEGLSIASQAAHFAAAGVWFGGLAALLLGIRAAGPEERSEATRRFAVVALGALLLVLVTGTLRAVDELPSWGALLDSGYGRAVIAKVALFGLIVALAARNRSHGVPMVSRDPGALRRTGRWELGLAVVALAVAALLGTLAPPIPGGTGLSGLSASGTDFATTTRVELTTASDQPGPNTFTARVTDYDSGEPLRADVDLTFAPLDDPGIGPSSLALSRRPDGSYVGTGANLAFDGRWRIDASVRRGSDSVQVPLELEIPGPDYFVSVLRVPDRPPKYTMQVGSIGYIQLEPDPELPGPSDLRVRCYTLFGSISLVEELVLTLATDGPARQQRVRRLGVGRFVSEVGLEAGQAEIGVVAKTRDGTRLRGVFQLEIPDE